MKKALLLIAALALATAAFSLLRARSGHGGSAAPGGPPEAVATGPANGPRPALGAAGEVSEPVTTAQDRAQAEILDGILSAHNDNDPRLDTDLKTLDPGAKALFQRKYDLVAPEKRNARGTVVFLLGRNLTRESDLAFMAAVLAEPPCRSLQNCLSDPPHSGDVHGDLAVNVTLAYPQIVALKSLERVLEGGKANPLYQQSLDLVHQATQSPVAKVAEVARGIEAKYGR